METLMKKERLEKLRKLRRRKELEAYVCKWRTIYQSNITIIEFGTGRVVGQGFHYYDHADGSFYYQFMVDENGKELDPGNYSLRIDSDPIPVISPFVEQ